MIANIYARFQARRRLSISPARPDPDDLLPLTPAVMHIMLMLTDGPRHGYAIMNDARMITVNKKPMAPGTLYGTVKRMLRDNLIVEFEQAPAESNDVRRRYYALTEFGRDVFRAETARLFTLYLMARDQRPE